MINKKNPCELLVTSRNTENNRDETPSHSYLFEIVILHRSVGFATIGNKSVRHFWILNRLPRWNSESKVVRQSFLQLNRCVSLSNSSLGCLLMVHCCANSSNHFQHSLFAMHFPAPPRPAPGASRQRSCLSVGGVCLILPAGLPRLRFELLIKAQLKHYF